MRAKVLVSRVAQSLLLSAGATVAVGEASEKYDASRHVTYAAQRLQARRERAQRSAVVASSADEAASDSANDSASPVLWLQRETPKFPYIIAMSTADNPASVASALLGTSDYVIGAPDETTRAMLDALVVPDAPLDALVQRVASQWRAFKSGLHGDVPVAFDPQRRVTVQRMDDLLAALRAVAAANYTRDTAEDLSSLSKETSSPSTTDGDTFVFFLRDFDNCDDAIKTAWLQWVHTVTTDALAHVVVPTTATVTPAAICEWQRVYKVPDADFVAILLRAATRACDPSSAEEKLRTLSQQYALDLRGLEAKHLTNDTDNDVVGFEPPPLPSEAELIVETVGNWWKDLDTVCRALDIRGLRSLTNDDERLVLVQQVCEEYEREAMIHVLSTLAIHDDVVASNDPENRDRRISALQAWKCLEVVTQVGDDAQLVSSPQKLLQRETDKPANCAHPVEALLPFNQRVHGEAKFLELLDREILFLRPKTAVEIGVVPCDAKSLVAPCWVETRPLIKRAFEKLWRDDAQYAKVLELERFEDNHKLSEEVALYEEEINERRKVLDKETREFIMLQHALKKHEIAQRKAELALLELEIQSKLVYLERLRGLLD